MTTETFKQTNQSRALHGFQPQWFFTIMLFFIAGIKLCFLNADHCQLMVIPVIPYTRYVNKTIFFVTRYLLPQPPRLFFGVHLFVCMSVNY